MNLPKILVAILVLSMAVVSVNAAPMRSALVTDAPNGGFKCPQEWCAPMYSGQNYQVTVNGNYHTVNVYGYTSQPYDCGISVDGILQWIPEGQNQTINGTNVKIRQVMATGLTTLNPFYVATGCYVCIKP